MKRIFYFLLLLSALMACEDDDSFSSSSSMRLTFETDTLKMDTMFSKSASRTYEFWVYNKNSKGLRLSSVRLSKGNQTGLRVNVDGSYLDNSNGSQVNNLELRRKDSLLVFVELTPSDTHQPVPRQHGGRRGKAALRTGERRKKPDKTVQIKRKLTFF
jgi:hypothetical protein